MRSRPSVTLTLGLIMFLVAGVIVAVTFYQGRNCDEAKDQLDAARESGLTSGSSAEDYRAEAKALREASDRVQQDC